MPAAHHLELVDSSVCLALLGSGDDLGRKFATSVYSGEGRHRPKHDLNCDLAVGFGLRAIRGGWKGSALGTKQWRWVECSLVCEKERAFLAKLLFCDRPRIDSFAE